MEDPRPTLRDRTNSVHDSHSHSTNLSGTKDDREMVKNALAQLDEINVSFDESIKDITELLGLVADNAVATHTDRTESITELRERLKSLEERAEQAKQKSLNVESLLERQRYVQQLESERQDLIQEILAGTDQTERLKQRTEDIKEKMEELQQQTAKLKAKQEDVLPTYDFLRKIFRQVSQAKIVKSDGDVLEGFVSKAASSEVIPFRYDRNVPTFDRVNDLWNKISE